VFDDKNAKVGSWDWLGDQSSDNVCATNFDTVRVRDTAVGDYFAGVGGSIFTHLWRVVKRS